MSKFSLFLGCAFLVMWIAILWGYTPGRFELLCAYLACAFAYFSRAFEGDSN